MSGTTVAKGRFDWTKLGLGVWGVLVFVFLFLPIVWILVYSFNTGRILTDWNGFGFDGYRAFFENPAPRSAVRVSLIVAVLSALVATLLGSLAGVALARRPGKWTVGFLFLVALVLVTPEIVDAIALLPWYVLLGQDFKTRGKRTDEMIEVLRKLWTGEMVSHEGRFYRFTLMNPMFSGGPSEHPGIPIWIAGVNPVISRAAGEVADGFHVHPLHSVSYLREVVIPAIEEGAKRAGRRRSDIQLYSPVFAATGDTRAEWDRSVEEIRRQISFYGSTPTYRPVLEHHGHGDLARRLSDLARRGEWKEMAKLVPDSLVGAIGVIEKPSALPKAIRDRYAGILDRVSLYFPIRAEDSEAAWQAFTKAFRG